MASDKQSDADWLRELAAGFVEIKADADTAGRLRAIACRVEQEAGLRWRIEELEAENQRLRAALQAFVDMDDPGVCYCDDWLIVMPGTKCKYCNARAALQPAPAGTTTED